MDSQMHKISLIAELDKKIDDLREEYGDLPERIKKQQEKTDKLKTHLEETKKILKEIEEFFRASYVTIEDLKVKEEDLSKKQFKVRNNKEFDAITKQIDFIREEHSKLTNQIKTENLKKENLTKILASQEKDFEESDADLKDIKNELELIENNQNQELQALLKDRKKIAKTIDSIIMKEYDRIRTHLKDAAVHLRRNSCTGCFSSVPPQIIVEARNNLNKAFICENCGRMIIPDEADQ